MSLIEKAASDWYEKECAPKASIWIDGVQYHFAPYQLAFMAGVQYARKQKTK